MSSPTNVSVTWGTLLREATQQLEAAGVPHSRLNAEWILADALACQRVHLLAHPRRKAMPEQVRTVRRLLDRRAQREPLQYVLGHADFFGLRLRVTPEVLIPRPETEQVVETALARLQEVPRPRVLDVGTGSGCIPLAIKHRRPEAEVFGCDVSPAALAVARSNAEIHGLAITLIQVDVLAAGAPVRLPSRLDALISNPPYLADDETDTLAPEVRTYEPHLALFAG